ncbi:MAG: DMT family transporter [Thermodesulfobacteriota bacterium]
MDERLFYGMAALASSASWALGAVLWRRLGDSLSPFGSNLAKGLIGSGLLAAALALVGAQPVSAPALAWLGLSGVLGIAVGDTFFFRSLMDLGPRLASLLGTLNPFFIALCAAAFLGERPAAAAWAGICLTAAGVGWVLWERTPEGGLRQERARGLRSGLVAVACTVAAVLLAKKGLEEVPPVQAALVRLSAGTLGLLAWGARTHVLGAQLRLLRQRAVLARAAAVVCVVTFGGFMLSLVALSRLDASIAGALGATSPLFVLPMAALWFREPVTVRSVIGTAVAVGGVALLLQA